METKSSNAVLVPGALLAFIYPGFAVYGMVQPPNDEIVEWHVFSPAGAFIELFVTFTDALDRAAELVKLHYANPSQSKLVAALGIKPTAGGHSTAKPK